MDDLAKIQYRPANDKIINMNKFSMLLFVERIIEYCCDELQLNLNALTRAREL